MNLRVPRRIISLALLAAAVPAATACGAAPELSGNCDRYAATHGSDRARGTEQAPYRTAQRLADALRPGETGCLRAGVYDETVEEDYVVSFDRGGRPGAPITLRSFPGERATLRGIVDVDADAPHVAIGALSIVGTTGYNTIKVYAEDVLIEGNDITNQGRDHSCIFLGSPSAGAAIDVTVRRNYLHDCGAEENDNKDHGIYAAKVRGGDISENLIVDPAGYAVQLYPDARNVRVAHNVIDGGRAIRGGIVIGGDDDVASSGNSVENNVIAHTATAGVTGYWPDPVGTDNDVRQNCFFDTQRPLGPLEGLSASGNITADPQFLDRDRRDYRLAPASPCRRVVGVDVAATLAGLGLTPAAGTPAVASREPRSRAQRLSTCRRLKSKPRRKRCRARVARRFG